MFNKIIIIGLGLIGGSIAKDVRKNKLSNEILAYGRDREKLKFALNAGIIDRVYDFSENIGANDLVIIATPLDTYKELALSLLKVLDKNTIIIDAGSVKSFVRLDILPLLNNFAQNFIPCHPIAGSDKSGVENCVDNLFLNKQLIITQNEFSKQETIAKVVSFWENIGAKIEFLKDEKHDKIFALTSHLPQLISHDFKNNNFSFNTDNDTLSKHLRLENSNQSIWQDIFNFNVEFIKPYIAQYQDELEKIHQKISLRDYKNLFSSLNNALRNLDIKGQNMEISSDNIDKILIRLMSLCAYISIGDIRLFKQHIGSGFKDFTIILIYLKYLLSKEDLLIEILDRHHEYLINSLNKLKEIKL